MTQRGSVCWADLGEPRGSKPARRRPVLVIQADPFNASRLSTTLAAVITSNTGLAAMPGNVFLPATSSGLPKDSVVNVTALVTPDEAEPRRRDRASPVSPHERSQPRIASGSRALTSVERHVIPRG